jgi:hypothetical protein
MGRVAVDAVKPTMSEVQGVVPSCQSFGMPSFRFPRARECKTEAGAVDRQWRLGPNAAGHLNRGLGTNIPGGFHPLSRRHRSRVRACAIQRVSRNLRFDWRFDGPKHQALQNRPFGRTGDMWAFPPQSR